LLTWLNHVSYGTSAVDDVRKAIQQWLDAAQDRDVSLAAALIASDDTALHAWMIKVFYEHFTGRAPTPAICAY
ncbi:hypothetical protein, partial [Escherichia coli]|uniref:hypothetical protein n=1 Tax=Escherichia coli TaxID=562 RepID=UPI0013D58115